MKVLVVDDEVKLADVVGELLRRNKFVVDVVYNGDDGFFYAKNGDYDVVVLDVMPAVSRGWIAVPTTTSPSLLPAKNCLPGCVRLPADNRK